MLEHILRLAELLEKGRALDASLEGRGGNGRGHLESGDVVMRLERDGRTRKEERKEERGRGFLDDAEKGIAKKVSRKERKRWKKWKKVEKSRRKRNNKHRRPHRRPVTTRE